MSRHNDLTLRSPELVKKAASTITKSDIDNFIQTLITNFEEKGLTEFLSTHPENFVNMDESAFVSNSQPDKILTSKTIPHSYHIEASKHHESFTVTVTISADGHMYTPQIIFKDSFNKMEDVCYAAMG